MAFWSKLFGSAKAESGPVKSIEYKGYQIDAVPYPDGGQYQLAGVISKTIGGDRKEHRFVRADKFTNRDEAADIAIAKGQLIIDQMGDRLFG